MPKTEGTAREFILETLRQHPDRELRVADLSAECGGRFTQKNIANTLARLQAEGLVVKETDADHSVWWGIAGELLPRRHENGPTSGPTLRLVQGDLPRSSATPTR